MAQNPSLSQSHQPQLLRQLRQRSLTLQQSLTAVQSQLSQKQQTHTSLTTSFHKLQQQTQIQEKKHRSLIVLLNQLQQSYHTQYLEQKQQQEIDQVGLGLENGLLRYLLIRKTEDIKEGEKAANIMKYMMLDKNRGKAKEYIKKSNFIQGQSQLIAKLKSQLYMLKNENLECKRKWYQLQQQSKSLQSHNKLLSIQNQRQKVEIKTMYQEYLERINEAKMKVVSFNETQKQSTINQYFVKEIAVLQQKRVEIEEESNNLRYHYQNLKEELERIQVENKELLGFFTETGQQGTLAQKMKKRIEELRDVLLECKKKNKNTRGTRLRKILQNIKTHHKMLVQSNDYVELKTREQQNYGSILEEKPIADFFSKLLEQKDKSISVLAEEQQNLKEGLKQLQLQRQLLQNQITSLEDNLSIDNWQTKFTQNKNWSSIPQQLPGSGNSRTKKSEPSQENLSGYGYDGNFTFDRRKH